MAATPRSSGRLRRRRAWNLPEGSSRIEPKLRRAMWACYQTVIPHAHADNTDGVNLVGMKLVQLESPYAADTPEKRSILDAYAREAMRDCLLRGEAPYAPHMLYTQPGVLRDDEPKERALGMNAGFAFLDRVDHAVAYIDYGISAGMKESIARAYKLELDVQFRRLY